jgi:hypothetical protein
MADYLLGQVTVRSPNDPIDSPGFVMAMKASRKDLRAMAADDELAKWWYASESSSIIDLKDDITKEEDDRHDWSFSATNEDNGGDNGMDDGDNTRDWHPLDRRI